jgi:glucose uptake protein GlcU
MNSLVFNHNYDERIHNASNSTLSELSGFILLGASSVLYGSNYIPVKQFETGDGMFFQLIFCIAMWVVGVLVNIFSNFPRFYAFPLLGGALTATANALTVPIIKIIGMGLGTLFWATTSLLTGWITLRFGFCDLKAEVPSKTILNYIGISLILTSAAINLFVKTDLNGITTDDETVPLIMVTTNRQSFFDKLTVSAKRTLGISLAIVAGSLYGQLNTPIVFVRDNYPNASQNNLDYFFSFSTGMLVTSVVYFTIYCIVKGNRPDLYPEIVLPGILSGLMFGIGTVCFYLSANVLSQAISSPISCSGPPIVASLWGVFLYKEIKGWRNLLVLSLGFCVSITGAVLTGLSF